MSKIYPIVQDKKLTRQLLISSGIVIVTELLVTTYALFGLFGIVPINIPIFALLLIILVIVNLQLFVVGYKARESIGIRSALALIVWSGMVFGYWIFAPIYYLLSMYFDALQLRWVVFAFIWEVPVVGGIFILLVIFLFRPIYRFLEGKSQDVKPDEFYKRLNSFPILIGALLVATVVGGYIIGTLQLRFFGHMSLVEQLKNIISGAVSSLLVGVFLALLSDFYLNRVRFYANKQFEVKTKPLNKFTSKIVVSTMLIIVAGIGMSGMLSFKSAQGLIRQLVVEESISDLNIIVSSEWAKLNEKDKKTQLDQFKNDHNGEVFVGESNLERIGMLESTREYISTHAEGVIDDYQYNLKTIIFKVDPTTGEKIISVIYITDQYTKLLQGIGFSFFGGIFVLVTSGLVILFYKKSIARPLSLIQQSIINESISTQIPDLATGDEFEELADAIVRYKSEIRRANRDLKLKVEEQTEEMAKQLLDIEQKNAFLEDTKKAVFNILEDAQELQIQLKDEKENVEKKVKERTHDLEEKTLALKSAQDEISSGWLQLQEEKARLTASINSLPKGFIITDLKKVVITANVHVASILGPTEDPWTIQEIEKRLGESLNIEMLLDKVYKKVKPQKIEEYQLKDVFLRILILPIVRSYTNKCIGAVILIEDITEEKVLSRSKDEFFSIASHELRTPLTSIRGNTSLIQQYYPKLLKDKNLKEMINDIYDSSTRLIQIVNDFLDVSRIEQGRLEYKIEKVNLEEIVKSVVQELQANANEKNLILNFECKSQDKFVLADEGRVRQIVLNLVGNAIKYTEKGEIQVLMLKDKTHLVVQISDSGRGIPMESRALLFRKFQQASNNLFTRDTTKGTGLGLYVARMLARGMHGDVELINSEEGKGSTFALSLPIA